MKSRILIRITAAVSTYLTVVHPHLASASASELPEYQATVISIPAPAEGDVAGLGQESNGTANADSVGLPRETQFSAAAVKEWIRPHFNFAAEFQSETDDLGIVSYDSAVQFPAYPLFGPPPPIISFGFDYTRVDAPAPLGLPADLYETELGFTWMRRLNDRWMLRLMAGTSFATDGNNQTSDAWRFRGGAFAIYQRDPTWTWTVGAIALGRNDLPLVPAFGVIHQPHPAIRFDVLMPRPRISFLLADNGPRQQWSYFGAALDGTTWGVERVNRTNDQLTYGDFRLVVGWESAPTPEPGIPFTRGRKLGAELAYVFSRDFAWERDGSKIRLDDSLLLRSWVNF